MAEGQRLLWWQEEMPRASYPSAASFPKEDLLCNEHRDVGEELESEARKRATLALQAANPVAPLDFFLDVTTAQARMRQEWRSLLGLLLACSVVGCFGIGSAIFTNKIDYLFSVFMVIVCSLHILLRRRRLRRKFATLDKPIIRLTAKGIYVNNAMRNYDERPLWLWREIVSIDLLKWQDIASIHLGKFGDTHYMTVQTKQTKGRRKIARQSEINLYPLCLPLSPKEMAAHIASYRASVGTVASTDLEIVVVDHKGYSQ